MGSFEKYARQTALAGFGEEGQRRLAESAAAVVGAGGVGSGALPLLAASGIGRLAVFDFDAVSETNLHRQTLYGGGQRRRTQGENCRREAVRSESRLRNFILRRAFR